MQAVAQAIETARSEGAALSIIEGGRIEVLRPEHASERLAAALEAIRRNRNAALELLRKPDPPTPGDDALKGSAVLMVCETLDDARLWIVADAEDAAKLRRSGVEAGDVVLERSEARELVRVADPDAVRSILAFKRCLPGRIRGEDGPAPDGEDRA